MDKEKGRGEKKERKQERNERKEQREREREREREGREKKREIFQAFRLSELDGPRRKVDPRIASNAWVPKSWSFVKLHEVGNFPTWNILNLKAM